MTSMKCITKSKPKYLRVERSLWYGKTIFTDQKILKDKVIAITSKENLMQDKGYFITPFGNLFNSTHDYNDVNLKFEIEDDMVKIIASRDINKGEELLLKYNYHD